MELRKDVVRQRRVKMSPKVNDLRSPCVASQTGGVQHDRVVVPCGSALLAVPGSLVCFA